jgi:NADH-quinone oxidoreductase subunit J
MRALVLACALAFAAVAVVHETPAFAQATADQVVQAPQAQATTPTPPPGKVQALLFWLFAAIAIGGAIAMVTRRNAVSAVMSLVGSFIGLAALYVLLYAGFLAVIQILVYAGAIMVLFVFVVMLLNKEEEEPWALRDIVVKTIAGAALLYFLVRLIQVLWAVPQAVPEVKGALAGDFGTTAGMAQVLFGSYLFPFEAVSVVLLIAVVGALVLAHPGHPNIADEENP